MANELFFKKPREYTGHISEGKQCFKKKELVYTLWILHIKSVTNENLLHSSENSTQGSLMT